MVLYVRRRHSLERRMHDIFLGLVTGVFMYFVYLKL